MFFKSISQLILLPVLIQGCMLQPSKSSPLEPPSVPIEFSRNLTYLEMQNFFEDNFNSDTSVIFEKAPVENSIEGTKNVQSPINMTSGRANFLHQHSLLLSSEILKNKPELESHYILCRSNKTCLSDQESIIFQLGYTFYRRPLNDIEVQLIGSLTEKLGDLSDSDKLKVIISFLIQSPQFHMFSPSASSGASSVRWREYISVVALFLWKSLPSAELLKQSESIENTSQLHEILHKMIDDPRSIRGARYFFTEWLGLDPLDGMVKNADIFRVLSPNVFPDAKEEILLTLETMWNEGGDIRKIVNNDFTFMNDKLGKIYGINIEGSNFQRVDLSSIPHRTGLLTSVAFSSLLSKSIYSAPTSRGLYVINKLFCEEVPPPPPGLGAFLPDTFDEPVSRREKMAVHASAESCTGCHNLMDPIGLGLENFNAIGQYRPDYVKLNHILPLGDEAIEVQSEISSNGGIKAFESIEELSKVIENDSRLSLCISQKIASYAYSRKAEDLSDELLQHLSHIMIESNGDLKAIFLSIVKVGAPNMEGVEL